MKKILISVFLSFIMIIGIAQSETQKIHASVVGFFNGLSLIDVDTLRHYSTADFHLLEDGEIWNLDTLLNKVMPRKNAGINRVNKFVFERTEVMGKMAWVSYHNSAEFSKGDKKQTVRWMESAVLRKEKRKWKIQMLHSTPLE